MDRSRRDISIDTPTRSIHSPIALGSPNPFGYTNDGAISSQSSFSIFSTPLAPRAVIIPLHVSNAAAKAAKRLWSPGSRCEGK